MFKKILTFFPIADVNLPSKADHANQHENPSLPNENFVEQLACESENIETLTVRSPTTSRRKEIPKDGAIKSVSYTKLIIFSIDKILSLILLISRNKKKTPFFARSQCVSAKRFNT
jgi:hypothetical protein